MLVTFLERLGFGTLIGALIALTGVIVVLSVRMVRFWDSRMKVLEGHVKSARVRLVEIAHAAYHTLQVELLSPHPAIHVEVRSIHHVMQLDVTRHHELWIIIKGTMTLGELIIVLGMFLFAASRTFPVKPAR